MKPVDVSEKHILITGAGSGIGAASATLLASRGAHVGVADLNASNAQTVVDQILAAGGNAYALMVDVSDADSVKAMFADAIANGGAINAIINNAGIDHKPAPMLDVSDDTLAANIAVNLTGVWLCMKGAIAHMLQNGGGQVINIASVAGLKASPTLSAYSATKHAVVGLSKTAAFEYARANIRVNAVCPSFVDTPMVQSVLASLDERGQRAIVGANPMKRLGKAEEIASAIAWLCSDESSFMTGQSVVLDGGLTA